MGRGSPADDISGLADEAMAIPSRGSSIIDRGPDLLGWYGGTMVRWWGVGIVAGGLLGCWGVGHHVGDKY